MTRIVACLLVFPGLLSSPGRLVASPPETIIEADLLIVGGTESGCAAAVQAARMGVEKIVLVNDIDWLGGQFSAEGLVAIDENRGPQGYGHGVPMPRHGMFKEVITRIEELNKQKYGVARPGNTRVITTCRPADAAKVFEDLLERYVRNGQVQIIRCAVPLVANLTADGKNLRAVRFRSLDTKKEFTVEAKLTIDASDWGDVIKLAGAAYEFGPDLKSKYAEPEAPTLREEYPITDMNPITYCLVVEETDTYEPIPKPPGYDARNYDQHRWPKDPLWLYESRRIVDHYHFPQIQHPDVVLLCFPAIDYPLDRLPKFVVDALESDEVGASKKNIVEMTRSQRQIVFNDAKQYSRGFLYDLQTRVHEQMKDQTHSFRRFRLTEEFGTPDKLPPKPYLRESLRLKAMYMMRQQDVLGWHGNSRNYADVMYSDSVAAWQFEFDFHPTRREFLDNGDPGGPWRSTFRPLRNWGPPYSGRATFPLRSLIPERVDGLLGAQHNLGFSSIVSSAVRLHDQSMAIGQAAGATAATALKHNVAPRKIPGDAELLRELQKELCTRHEGGESAMLWPFGDLQPDHPAFEAANLLAVRKALPLGPHDADFQPDREADLEWRRLVVQRSLATKALGDQAPPAPPEGPVTRGEFVIRWWAKIQDLPENPFGREKPDDADADGLPDAEDPLPFNPQETSWPDAKLPADRDGLLDPLPRNLKLVRTFNFTRQGSAPVEGFTNDVGQPFEEQRGYGWGRDLTANHRRRGMLPEPPRDTFLFTREYDQWECTVPNGKYHVTVCVGDADFEQVDQRVKLEGQVAIDDQTTGIGEFCERTVIVNVQDGRLTVDLGQNGRNRNTCLNWLQIAHLRPESPNQNRQGGASKENSLIKSIDKVTLRRNRDGKGTTWFHPRACMLPETNRQPTALMTLQEIGGSDYFGPVQWSESKDGGKSWSEPEVIPSLARQPVKGHPGLMAGVCDVVPKYHHKTGTVLALGHVVFYRGPRFARGDQLARYPVYAVRRKDGSWSERKILKWDDPRGAHIYTNNCGQRVVLPNGEIVMSFTFGPTANNRMVAGVRCSFDGEELKILKVGPPLKNPVGRGLLEPSVTKFSDKFYLTMRAEDGLGYVAISEDGLHYKRKTQWAWDDGEPIAMSTTQQHWLTHSDGLFLVYTRKDPTNTNVIRWRSPLWVAQVDPEKLCLMRGTEQVVLPLVGDGVNKPDEVALMGNFHVTNASPQESWVTVGEWMPRRGARGDLLMGKIRWTKPNRMAVDFAK